MPPKENDRLSREQTWAVRDWINAGAPWPDDEKIAAIVKAHEAEQSRLVRVATSGGLSDEWTDRRYDPKNLWAYQPLERLAVPAVPGATHPIDAFINHRLTELGIEPAPRAERRELIRRATFDLLGLPPTPEDVERFVNDPAGDAEALARLVDRLLARPQYGERYGRHWLDVVRYADTAGFANDYERPNAWRYRDYVIRAFNEDKPYDRFVVEQLAGDEVDPDDPEMLVATGFLRMGPWEHTGMSVFKVTRQQFLDDVTDAVGQVFLSHPLQCCRCHDHKFDPIPTRDYYGIQAVFATTQFADRDAAFLPEENTRHFAEGRAHLEQRIRRYRGELSRINEKEQAAERQWYVERGLEYAPRAEKVKAGVPEDQIAPKRVGLTSMDFGLERIARKYLERHEWELDRYRPIAYSVYSGATREARNVRGRLEMPSDPTRGGQLEQTAILSGGDPFSPTVPVEPGVLSALPAADGFDVPTTPHGRRLALAEWIASPKNPLAARVIVNRVWQWHFGRGLAGNPNNFGAMGQKPSHPELLDWLAVWFMDHGWSVKRLNRLIMTSEAYARSSRHPRRELVEEKDTTGTSYAVFQPRRLTAEELRDAMLAVSGELNPEMGGVPVRPEMNREAALQPRQIMGTYAPAYQPSPTPAERNRRTVYAMTIRGQRDPFLEVFNQPGPESSCERREASTITPQVFTLFNGRATHDRALAMADRLLKETGSEDAAIQRAFRLAFGRDPSPGELAACVAHWQRMTAHHGHGEPEPQSPPTEVTRQAVDELSGETFEFTERLEAYADYVSDLKPWHTDARTRGLAEVCLVLMNANEFVYVP
jgi:hypothetical protein